MKTFKNLSIVSLIYYATSYAIVYGEDKPKFTGNFTIADPTNSLFDSSSKVVQGVHTAEWLIKGSAGLFAISCFVSAGNLARQGDYGRSAGAVVGGIIAAIGAYLVSLSQQ